MKIILTKQDKEVTLAVLITVLLLLSIISLFRDPCKGLKGDEQLKCEFQQDRKDYYEGLKN